MTQPGFMYTGSSLFEEPVVYLEPFPKDLGSLGLDKPANPHLGGVH